MKVSTKTVEQTVHHPNHYTFGGIECKDAWKACMSHEALCGCYKGNIIKYLWRYEHKNGVEDLKKARQYLDWLIAEEEAKANAH